MFTGRSKPFIPTCERKFELYTKGQWGIVHQVVVTIRVMAIVSVRVYYYCRNWLITRGWRFRRIVAIDGGLVDRRCCEINTHTVQGSLWEMRQFHGSLLFPNAYCQTI